MLFTHFPAVFKLQPSPSVSLKTPAGFLTEQLMRESVICWLCNEQNLRLLCVTVTATAMFRWPPTAASVPAGSSQPSAPKKRKKNQLEQTFSCGGSLLCEAHPDGRRCCKAAFFFHPPFNAPRMKLPHIDSTVFHSLPEWDGPLRRLQSENQINQVSCDRKRQERSPKIRQS